MKKRLLPLLALPALCWGLAAAPVLAAPSTPALPPYAAFYKTSAATTPHVFIAENGQFTSLANALPALLAESASHGLDPEFYGLPALQQALAAPKAPTPEEAAALELRFMFALWAYASDLAGLKLSKASLDVICQSASPLDTVRALAPRTPLYAALKTKLVAIFAETSVSSDRPLLSFGKKVLEPGAEHAAVPKLRERLKEYGANYELQSIIYDENLTEAVKKFQAAHGLDTDARVGGMTLTLLNRKPEEERAQIIASMQELRRIDKQNRPAKRVEVSIPRFTVFAIDNNEAVLSMKAIVGRLERQTVTFQSKIIGLRVNPTWTVPDTIKHEDMLNKLRHNQGKFNSLGVQIYASNGLKIDPKYIDWENVGRKEMARLRLWRPAGSDNPLGKYRVLMPNRHDIYLHDTNERGKFALANRALSSGCVRMEKPEAMAAFLIQGTKNWSMDRVKKTLSSGKTYDILFDTPIPVYIDYVTSWLNDEGQLVLGLDVYAKDRQKTALMKTEASQRLAKAETSLASYARIVNPSPLPAMVSENSL